VEYIGPVIGVLGLIAGAVYFYLNRKPKRLNYYVRSSQALLARESTQHRHKVQVLVDGKAANDPMSSVIRIENSGKVEIKADDYVEPLILDLGASKVLALSATTGPKPWDFKLDMVVAGIAPAKSELRLPPALFNEGDYVDLQILSDQRQPLQASLGGRLAGTKLIEGPPKAALRSLFSRKPRASFLSETTVAATIGAAGVIIATVVTVFAAPGDRAAVPNVREQPVSDAIELLNEEGFHVGDINRVPSTEPAGTVLDQSPAAPTKADTDEGVNLVIAE